MMRRIELKFLLLLGLILSESILMGGTPDPNPLVGTVNLPGPATWQLNPNYIAVRNWYVDGVNGNDLNDGKSQTKAFKTINKITKSSSLLPGDVINVAPGTYNEAVQILYGGTSNSPTGYVVLKSTVRLGAKIVGPQSLGNNSDPIPTVGMTANYLIVDGFEITGGGTGGGGITNGVNWLQAPHHHEIVINNLIHDCQAGGIEFVGGDYSIAVNNTIYRTASGSTYQESGISLAASKDFTGKFSPTSQDNVTYHNVVWGNISHDNILAADVLPLQHTDGEGIIIDTNETADYTFSTLVAYNVCFKNGGNGISVFRSAHTVVANNSCYSNFLDLQNNGTSRADISNVGDYNIYVNNISEAIPGSGYMMCNTALGDSGVSILAGITYGKVAPALWENNVGFNTSVGKYPWGQVVPVAFVFNGATISATHNQLGVNPLFTDPANAKFETEPASTCVGAAIPESFTKAPVNIGADQSTGLKP